MHVKLDYSACKKRVKPMDFSVDAGKNQCMSQQLCPRGVELLSKAAEADEVFKANLVQFFSHAKKDDRAMQQIEVLGVLHRKADEDFHQHKRLCGVCARTHTVSRYATAD